MTFYERALLAARHVGPPKVDVASVANDLGQALFFAGRLDEAGRAYRRAAAAAPAGSVLAASAALRIAVSHLETNRLHLCRRWLARGIAELGESNESGAAGVRVGLHGSELALAARESRFGDAVAAATAAVVAADYGDDSDKGQAHQLLAMALQYDGRFEESIVHARIAIEHLERTKFRGLLGDAYNALGTVLAARGEWSHVVETYAAAGSAFRSAGNTALDTLVSANLAEVLIDQGHYAEAEPIVAESLRVMRSDVFAIHRVRRRARRPYRGAFRAGDALRLRPG